MTKIYINSTVRGKKDGLFGKLFGAFLSFVAIVSTPIALLLIVTGYKHIYNKVTETGPFLSPVTDYAIYAVVTVSCLLVIYGAAKFVARNVAK